MQAENTANFVNNLHFFCVQADIFRVLQARLVYGVQPCFSLKHYCTFHKALGLCTTTVRERLYVLIDEH